MHEGFSDVCITPMNVEGKQSIKNKLKLVLSQTKNKPK
jgi:hypothetical protein